MAAGALYDATGTYRTAWLLSAACNVVAFVLVLACRPPARSVVGASAAVAGAGR
jgi:hypothetical protein